MKNSNLKTGFLILFGLILQAGFLTACNGKVKTGGTVVTAEKNIAAPQKFDKETLELANEYKALRKIKGLFMGGEWNEDVDKFGGRLHTVLGKLMKKLEGGNYAKPEVISLLGKPDSTKKENLIYFWRGWHDYVEFKVENDKIVKAIWINMFE